MPFKTPVRLDVPLDESSVLIWRTIEALYFQSTKYKYPNGKPKNYIVEEDYSTDLATIRRYPIVWWLFGAVAAASAVVHDFLYNHGMRLGLIKDRKEADDIFYEAMLSTKVPAWKAWAMYRAVRIGGESHFHQT